MKVSAGQYEILIKYPQKSDTQITEKLETKTTKNMISILFIIIHCVPKY